MRVSPDSPHQTDYKGTRYAFCCAGCLKKFQQDPERYLSPSSVPASHGPAEAGHDVPHGPAAAFAHRASAPGEAGHDVQRPGGKWTCPMHPEVVRDGPGDCPICGMALEPRTASAEEPENPELDEMGRRLRWSAVLTAPLLALAMGEMLPGNPLAHAVPPRVSQLAGTSGVSPDAVGCR